MSDTPFPKSSVENFDAQYQRILEAAESRTQVELASFLEIRQSSISDAKRRQSIPCEWLIKLFEKKRINPDWIRTGMAGKTLQTVEGEAIQSSATIRVIEHRPAKNCTTDVLLAELARRILKSIN